jgi:hypothetical protein
MKFEHHHCSKRQVPVAVPDLDVRLLGTFMSKSTFAFILLCVSALAVQILERYGLSHWEDGVVFTLLVVGLLLLVVLFGGRF